MAKAKAQGKMIANNKKAYHDYFILDNCTCRYGSKIPPYGKMQHQRILYPY